MISSFFSFFACFVISVSVIFSQTSIGSIPSHILSWLILALQPVFFYLFRYILKDGEPPIYNPVRLGIIGFVLLVLTIAFQFDIITFLLIVIAVVILVTNMDERILFALALVFLLGTVYALLIDDKSTAEELSIFVYYTLVLGVTISLIQKPISRLIARLPEYRFPHWWQSYIDELQTLLSLMHQILPTIILFFLTWSASPWGYLVSFETQFIGSFVLIYVVSSLVLRHEEEKIVKYLLPVMIICSLLLTWWGFTEDITMRVIFVISLIAISSIGYYRGEYVKTLAKKIFSL